MRLIFGLVLIAGLGLAGFAVYMAQNYIGAYEQALKEERAKAAEAASVPTERIWVAKRSILYGEPLSPEDVRLAHWPKDALPQDFFPEAEPPVVEGDLPRVATRQIEKNEALMKVKVSEPGGDAGLTSRLERGQRAFAIEVNVATGVSGFLRPGDRVDIYWTGNVRAEGVDVPKGEVTKLIQTGVELIAIDQTANTDSTAAAIARTVTVAATPQVVASLAQAQSTGRLSLSLMAAHDDTIAEAIEVDQRKLLGIEGRDRKAENKTLEVCTIRTRRGSDVVEIPIPCTN
ncbi:Flp pilus assembly protein CpaB [Roseivivax marinus]|uniref:Flp pilus assembly protein CpaB n=1 Tax=Roseivivax marinus TaxID=1379903 RepID=W4HMD6_9RHOB|nr:Flp pilus assembly protein CpaB [Roseivivax marinus]ETW13902.1 Flp pilus assembly protein CpaB [Roseivivax marinus]UMA63820.1 Flp pilus assembly protein CpaB [Roseivivax marinus]